MSATVATPKTGSAWVGRALGLILLAVVCGLAYWLGSTSRGERSIGGLVVPDGCLDLGEIWESDNYQSILPIRNTTGQDVDILDFISSCNCVSVEPPSLMIPAGHAREVRLTFDLKLGSRVSRESRRTLAVGIAPRLRNSNPGDQISSPFAWMIRAIVRSRATVDPPALSFWDDCVRGHTPPARTVRLTAHVPVVAVQPRYDPAVLSVWVRKAPGEGAGVFFLEVRPSPTLPSGAFALPVSVYLRTAEAQTVYGTTLQVEGVMREDIAAVPDQVFLGAQDLGASVTETVVLRSAAGHPFDVLSFDANGGGTIEPAKIDLATAKAFKVTHICSREGDQRFTVTFTVRAKGQDNEITVPVQFFYHGISRAQLGVRKSRPEGHAQ